MYSSCRCVRNGDDRRRTDAFHLPTSALPIYSPICSPQFSPPERTFRAPHAQRNSLKIGLQLLTWSR